MTDWNSVSLAVRRTLCVSCWEASGTFPFDLQFQRERSIPDFLPAGGSLLLALPSTSFYTLLRHQPPQSSDLGWGVGWVWTEEEFCLSCTFLPSLWGGQQRNAINTQCVGGWGKSSFCLSFWYPGSTHSSVSKPWSFHEGARTPANSCQ